ncbi:hypothetical protein [Halofilum ochraceum]|uniref:phage adaptor protein n=1 Tax=Halofilum ochraceum TaxID=1611323 RepID=UPI0008D9D037|nr:hypothetical protein [Halofilum ochraceum]
MKLEDLLHRVRPQVPGCPEDVAIDALRVAAEQLCRQSHLWQEKLPAVSIYSKIGDYQLPAPMHTRVVSPLTVHVEGRLLEHRHKGELDQWHRDWRDRLAPEPHFWTMNSPDEVVIVPKPEGDKIDALVATASLEPADGEADLPGWFHQYATCLKEGALAELKEIPGKPWSDPKMMQLHQRRFDREVARARYDVSRGFSDRPIRTTAYPR